MMKFFAVVGIIFSILFLGAVAFGFYISIATHIEEIREKNRNREKGNLSFVVDKAHRFKKK